MTAPPRRLLSLVLSGPMGMCLESGYTMRRVAVVSDLICPLKAIGSISACPRSNFTSSDESTFRKKNTPLFPVFSIRSSGIPRVFRYAANTMSDVATSCVSGDEVFVALSMVRSLIGAIYRPRSVSSLFSTYRKLGEPVPFVPCPRAFLQAVLLG